MEWIKFIQGIDKIGIEKKVKVEELVELLDELVKGLRGSREWRNMIEFMSRFHRYSFCNTLLILRQRPDATLVRGYKQWIALGRHVKRGEKGIAILVPMIRKIKIKKKVIEEDVETGEKKEVEKEVEEEMLTGFMVRYVYDIKQTEGKEIPCIDEFAKIIEGTKMEDRYEILKKVVEKFGIKLEIKRLDVNGRYKYIENMIEINEALPIDMRFKTLIHELAHGILAYKDMMPKRVGEEITVPSRYEEECIVESVAYIVANRFGLDTSQYSVGYIASYQEYMPEYVLRQDLSTIHTISEMIINEMEKVGKEEY
ncbi:MAG: ArdC-like ssDNA-binding domain-containing protein [Candidatus Nitrosocaldaceae archaeon]